MTIGEAVRAPTRSPSRLAALIALTAAGCSARVSRPPVIVATAPPAPRHARLYYEIDQRPLGSPPIPVVRATVGGVATNLMVESGSSPHALAGWLARRAHLALSAPNGEQQDNAGHSLATRFAEHPDVVIEGWGPLGEDTLVVAEMPEPFEAMNIGGLISPQMLVHPPAGVRLDLHQAELVEVVFRDELARIANQPGSIVAGWVRGCTLAGAQLPNVRFAVPVTVGGHDAALTVSTGTDRSFLLSNSTSIAPLLDQTQPNSQSTMGLGGEIEVRLLPNVDFHAGEVGGTGTFNVDIVHGPPEAACPHDGNLGIDLLAHCVLVMNSAQFAARCAQ